MSWFVFPPGKCGRLRECVSVVLLLLYVYFLLCLLFGLWVTSRLADVLLLVAWCSSKFGVLMMYYVIVIVLMNEDSVCFCCYYINV